MGVSGDLENCFCSIYRFRLYYSTIVCFDPIVHYLKNLNCIWSTMHNHNRERFDKGLETMDLTNLLSDEVIQDVLLASRIYNYYKCSKGNLLNIIALLSHYKKSLWIEFKNGQKIKNGIIESIAIYEDGIIELSINDKLIALKKIDEISNIFVLSSKYPSTSYGVPRMFKKTFMDIFKQQKEYPKMVEQYFENRNRDIQDDNLEKFLQRLMKPTKNCLSLTERADRQIKIITEE